MKQRVGSARLQPQKLSFTELLWKFNSLNYGLVALITALNQVRTKRVTDKPILENRKMVPTQMNLIAFSNSIKTSLDRTQNARGFDMIKKHKIFARLFMSYLRCWLRTVLQAFNNIPLTFSGRKMLINSARQQQILETKTIISAETNES